MGVTNVKSYPPLTLFSGSFIYSLYLCKCNKETKMILKSITQSIVY